MRDSLIPMGEGNKQRSTVIGFDHDVITYIIYLIHDRIFHDLEVTSRPEIVTLQSGLPQTMLFQLNLVYLVLLLSWNDTFTGNKPGNAGPTYSSNAGNAAGVGMLLSYL